MTEERKEEEERRERGSGNAYLRMDREGNKDK